MYTIFNTFYYYLISLSLSCAFQYLFSSTVSSFPFPVRFSYPSFLRAPFGAMLKGVAYRRFVSHG